MPRRREKQRIEEDEVRNALPIPLKNGMLPRELQHLAPAIARLESRGVVIRLSNGGGPRWALAKPWER